VRATPERFGDRLVAAGAARTRSSVAAGTALVSQLLAVPNRLSVAPVQVTVAARVGAARVMAAAVAAAAMMA